MPVDPSKWQNLLDQLDASSGGGDVYYLKQPKTRLRLVLPAMAPDAESDDDENFYAETAKHYQGKESTAFLVLAIVLGTSEKGDKNADPSKVRAVRLPKTALRAIVGALAEGHELFDEDIGHGVTIEKIGGAGSDRTSYVVQPSPKPVPIRVHDLTWPEKDLWTIADEEATRSAERDAKKNRANQAADNRAPTRGRNRPRPIDEDDDEGEEDLPF